MKRLLFLVMCTLMCSMATFAQDIDSLYAKDLLPAGTTAPNFTLTTFDGKKLSLSDNMGHYQVLDFWASWCGDCRKDIPAMKELHNRFQTTVTFIGISFDDKKENWNNCVQKNEMNWLHVSELKKWKETEISQLYKIKWLPTMYLISPAGKVILATTQIEKLAAKLEELVAAGEN